MALNSDAPMAVALFVSAASIVWAAVYAWTRWLVRPQQEPVIARQDHEDRLEQRLTSIEHAVQAIAVEVERVGEGQRLTTRLLADRLPADAAAPRLEAKHRRVDTPH
jgi:type VI protein secretion system component VasK